MNRIVVVGGGGHAKVLISVLKKLGREAIGYTDRVDHGAILGLLFLGDDAVLKMLRDTNRAGDAVLGLGKTKASDERLLLAARVEALGFSFPVVISPCAIVNEEVGLGSGTVVFDGAVINSGVVTGSHCVLNTHCTVEHDCALGDDVHIAPGAVLSGDVTVGDHSMIGAGATIAHGVSICPGCLVGAGSTVVKNIVLPGTYVGNPARRLP